MSTAAPLLGCWKAFSRWGSAAGQFSKKRGRPSNRKTVAALRAAVVWIERQNYADFGSALAPEKLPSENGFRAAMSSAVGQGFSGRHWPNQP